MATLYELSSDFLEAMELFDTDDYSIEAIQTTLDCIGYELEQKAENYAKYIRNIESEIDAFKAEEKRLFKKRSALESRVEFLKNNLEWVMKTTGKTKIKTKLFSFNIQKNPPSVRLIPDKKVPEQYLIQQKPVVNMQEIKKALKNGEQMEFAELVQGESLRIR